MKSGARMDLATGCVPDYRTFLRHVWSYEEPGVGSCLATPPWVYSCIFEDRREAMVARSIVTAVIEHEGVALHRVESHRLCESGAVVWDIRFRDLEVLHLFLVHLAAAAQTDPAARQVGEFLMWTLGFRWV